MESTTPSPSKINTLVKDIYDVFANKTKVTEEQTKELAETIANTVSSKMAGQGDHSGLRMSNFGTPCTRKLWYGVNFPQLAEALKPWTLLNFMIGHVLEDIILWAAKVSGKHTITGTQDKMEYQGVVGHRDAVIDGVLVDVKSANSRSYEKFKHHKLDTEDPFGYLDQLSLYAAASSNDPLVAVKKEAAFLAVDKELGHIVLDKYKVKEINADDIEAKKDILKNPDPPQRAFVPEKDGESGNLKLPFQCAYCQYKRECWKDSNGGQGLRAFLYSKGPVWLTRVIREPNVPELKE